MLKLGETLLSASVNNISPITIQNTALTSRQLYLLPKLESGAFETSHIGACTYIYILFTVHINTTEINFNKITIKPLSFFSFHIVHICLLINEDIKKSLCMTFIYWFAMQF